MNLIGVIPSVNKTFEVYGDFNVSDPKEGNIYYHPDTKRLFMYSASETRSNPSTGYFPVWNGSTTYISSFSKEKYFPTDVVLVDMNKLSSAVNKQTAERIRYTQRKSDNNTILKPQISDSDNMFTQCVKGTISAMEITMIDLVDMAKPKFDPKIIEGYYASLAKISFMRIDKWNIWVNQILHIGYNVDVFKGKKKLVHYEYPKQKFDTGIVKYNDILATGDDQFKKIIKILMVMENINKTALRSEDVDDYAINNMMTTLNSNKPLSAQLFSRFIRMAKLSYKITIYGKDGTKLFEFKE